MPSNSTAAIFDVEPIGTRMLLSTESTLLLGAIELLLGGSIDGGVKERRMTDIDQALGRHFFERLLAQLTLIWTDVAGLDLSLETVDQHMETAQMVSVSEPTLSFMIEARLGGISATLALLIPWSAIAPVADQFAARDDARSGTRSEEDETSVRRAVGDVEMTVRAEVAAVAMPIEAVLALKEGDLLRLNAPAAGGITLFADKIPVHTGRPGRSGSRRAVQVTGHVGGPAMSAADALNRLGQSTAEACLRRARDVRRGQGLDRRGHDARRLRARRSPACPSRRVAMSVSYVDGVTGGNVFLITLDGAKMLAASMMGMDEPEDPDATELSELELSAVSEAMNQMMASAAAATSRRARHRGRDRHARDQDLHRRRRDRRRLSADAARRAYRDVDLRRAGAARPARPERVRRAYVERARRHRRRRRRRPRDRWRATPRARPRAQPSLAGIPVRVWAELGRARMPSAQIVGLPTGAVVELDKQADDAIDLYVNGTHFATGRLVVVDGTDWAVRIEHVLDVTEINSESGMEVARWPESW